MVFEIMLVVFAVLLFLFVLLQESRINKLNNELNRCFKLNEEKADVWKHESLSNKIDRLQERYEVLQKDLGETDTRTFKDILNAKDDVRADVKVVRDQLNALANELGYSVSEMPAQYKVTKRT